jgi:hypothetical protein
MSNKHPLRSLGALLLLALMAALVALNWAALTVMATWQLGFAEVQLPVGAALLLLVAPLFVIYLFQRVGSLIGTRRLLREVQRLQKLADLAEASRIESLRALITHEFGRLHTRLDAVSLTDKPQAPAATTVLDAIGPDGPSAGTRVTAISRWFRSAL